MANSELSKSNLIALGVATMAGVAVWVAYDLADKGAPSVLGPKGAEVFFSGQISGIGGLIFGILISHKISDTKVVFPLASLALLLGVIMPWLYQIIPGGATSVLWTSARDKIGPALFSFGLAFLVKAADEQGPPP